MEDFRCNSSRKTSNDPKQRLYTLLQKCEQASFTQKKKVKNVNKTVVKIESCDKLTNWPQ